MLTRAFLAGLALCTAVLANQGSPTVLVDSGVLVGTTTTLPTATAPVNKFLGIPFAKSPPERFAPPERAPRERTPRNVTQFAPACIQQFAVPGSELIFNNPPAAESEDCLYLNVFAPSTPVSPFNPRAVLYWIYGGSLQFGTAGQPGYDGSFFAAYEDVVVVTVNYRTNVFGFPTSPELNVTARNLGFLDQRAGLDWVQRNIRAFGGDPEKVTIFGESAGAFSVDALLTSYGPNDKPPFRGGILESGQYSYRTPTDPDQTPSWDALTSALGCPGTFSSNLTCVRAANATKIKQIITQGAITYNPTVDNITLVANPAVARRTGQIAKVPILAGTNAQEGRVFVIGQNDTQAFVTATFGANRTQEIINAYPQNGEQGLNTPYDVIAQIFTEYIFQCPQAAQLNDSVVGGIPAWRYYFNATFTNTQTLPNLGAFHSSEIGIVYRTFSFKPQGTTTQEFALSQYMQSVWARFAKNPQGGPGWNAVGSGDAGSILVGANGQEIGGILIGANGTQTEGTYNVGVLGDIAGQRSSGVTIVPQETVDFRCGLYEAAYNAIRGEAVED